MPIQTTSKIWHNGNLIPWENANIHVMSHAGRLRVAIHGYNTSEDIEKLLVELHAAVTG